MFWHLPGQFLEELHKVGFGEKKRERRLRAEGEGIIECVERRFDHFVRGFRTRDENDRRLQRKDLPASAVRHGDERKLGSTPIFGESLRLRSIQRDCADPREKSSSISGCPCPVVITAASTESFATKSSRRKSRASSSRFPTWKPCKPRIVSAASRHSETWRSEGNALAASQIVEGANAAVLSHNHIEDAVIDRSHGHHVVCPEFLRGVVRQRQCGFPARAT